MFFLPIIKINFLIPVQEKNMLQVKPVPRQVLCSHETKNTFENVPDDVGWCPEGPDLGQGAGLDVADRVRNHIVQKRETCR